MIACSCGRAYKTGRGLRTQGWREIVGGDVARMVGCKCGRPIVAEVLDGACVCRSCASVIRGTSDDPKILCCSGTMPGRPYCRRCAPSLIFDGVDDMIEDARAALLDASRGARVIPVYPVLAEV